VCQQLFFTRVSRAVKYIHLGQYYTILNNAKEIQKKSINEPYNKTKEIFS